MLKDNRYIVFYLWDVKKCAKTHVRTLIAWLLVRNASEWATEFDIKHDNRSFRIQVISYPGHFIHTFGHFVPSNNHFVPRLFRTHFCHFLPSVTWYDITLKVNSYPSHFVPTLDISYLRHFVPRQFTYRVHIFKYIFFMWPFYGYLYILFL